MRKRRDVKLPVALERVQGRFADWREQKQGRERIPEELWKAAVRVARRHGVNQVSSILNLDYSHLKRRIGKNAEAERRMPVANGVFVEMEGMMPERDSACVVEIEKENGTRMRISVQDVATVDWRRMKEAFLGA
ncbi:MAG: hypothetical protein DRP42_05600 [Tenericutes bacterium]|nr:MAG: hypothetical protein DRP42_05600 [Mycoplasmatota bacterium]